MLDASISAWDCKRSFDSVRPITAIRTLYAGRTLKGFLGPQAGIGDMAGENWSPYQPSTFITPPFGEFVSGHSTFSAAGAQVLELFTGSDTFGGSATIAQGSLTTQLNLPSQAITLSWSTFTAAANEAGLSRLLGGIHFDAGNDDGKSLGRKVGAMAYAQVNRLLSGSAMTDAAGGAV
jgi:hypothetical protein